MATITPFHMTAAPYGVVLNLVLLDLTHGELFEIVQRKR
jgi:hypothetical protein